MTDDPSSDAKPAGVRVTAPACVRCGKPVQARFRPFCSQRCADLDLGAWFGERYRVPTEEGAPEAPVPGDDDA